MLTRHKITIIINASNNAYSGSIFCVRILAIVLVSHQNICSNNRYCPSFTPWKTI